MKVYVVMGNDFPDCVWAKKKNAEHYIKERKKAQKRMNNDEPAKRVYWCSNDEPAKRVYWCLYEFEVLGGGDVGND